MNSSKQGNQMQWKGSSTQTHTLLEKEANNKQKLAVCRRRGGERMQGQNRER